jgi:Oxidoreductase molybdopterin binding domain
VIVSQARHANLLAHRLDHLPLARNALQGLGDRLAQLGEHSTTTGAFCRARDKDTLAIDMPTALHPQTLMAFRLSDEILPTKYGYPFNIRIPTKLGFKNPKFVTAIYVTDKQPLGCWTDRGYNWFSGICMMDRRGICAFGVMASAAAQAGSSHRDLALPVC